MKFICHVDPERDWPVSGFLADGMPIRLADVEATLEPFDRGQVYFLNDRNDRVYPWKNAGYFEDEGAAVAPVGLPMTRKELVELGLTDAVLSAEHAAYFATTMPLPGETAPDDGGLQRRRRVMFDEVTAKWTSGAERRAE